MKIIRCKYDISEEVAESFKDSIAVDTEATGLKVDQGRDKLSLIQVCAENGNVYVISPNRKDYKCPNLVKVLQNDKILKIFHFARFDKKILERFLNCEVKNVWCTKIGSKLTRTYSGFHGLKNLVQEFCNVNLKKDMGSSDWNKDLEDLTDAQLQYATNDVIYLHKVKNEIEKMLIRENRQELFLKCIKFLDTRIELDKNGFDETDIFLH